MALERAEVKEMIESAILTERERLAECIEAMQVPTRFASVLNSHGGLDEIPDKKFQEFKDYILRAVRDQ